MVFIWLLQKSIVEMTGSATKQEERKELWEIAHKRIYFATPQCFNNDVTKGDGARPGTWQHALCKGFQLCQDSWVAPIHSCLYKQHFRSGVTRSRAVNCGGWLQVQVVPLHVLFACRDSLHGWSCTPSSDT